MSAPWPCVDFFLDDIAPDTLGKPLFGAPQARGHY